MTNTQTVTQTVTQTETRTGRLSAHGRWRPDWTSRRTCLLWYLTFEDQPLLHDWQDRARWALADTPCVDVVPSRWLHLTLTDLDYADVVGGADLEAVVAAARTGLRDLHLPTLQLGPVTTQEDCLVLAAGPVDQLARLTGLLREAGTHVLGTRTLDGVGGFAPHVTVGYVNDDCDEEAVLGPLGPMAGDTLSLQVAGLTLAAVTRRGTHYEWTSTATLPLTP